MTGLLNREGLSKIYSMFDSEFPPKNTKSSMFNAPSISSSSPVTQNYSAPQRTPLTESQTPKRTPLSEERTSAPSDVKKPGKLNTKLAHLWNQNTGPKRAENIAKSFEKFVSELDSGDLILLVKMFKKVPLGREDGHELVNENYASAVTAINKKYFGKVPVQAMRVPETYKNGGHRVVDLGVQMKRLNNLLTWDHIAIILKSDLHDMFVLCAEFVRPAFPDFLYCKAYYTSVPFRSAVNDWMNRFTYCKLLIITVLSDGVEKGIETIKKIKEPTFQDVSSRKNSEIDDLREIKYEQQVAALIIGSYLVDAKLLGQNAEVKQASNKRDYRVEMGKCYLKVIQLYDWAFDDSVVNRIIETDGTMDMSPTGNFGSAYWECLNELRNLLRMIKSKVFRSNTGVPEANNRDVSFVELDEVREILDSSEFYKQGGRGGGRKMQTNQSKSWERYSPSAFSGTQTSTQSSQGQSVSLTSTPLAQLSIPTGKPANQPADENEKEM